MASVIKGDWKAYSVAGEPSTEAEFNDACVPFSVVMHAAHVRPALDIVRDRKVKASRISDESHFTNTDLRIWVSVEKPLVFGALWIRKSASVELKRY